MNWNRELGMDRMATWRSSANEEGIGEQDVIRHALGGNVVELATNGADEIRNTQHPVRGQPDGQYIMNDVEFP